MGVTYTRDQQKVIDLRDCNILVSAAAGSGKTAVLVERIVKMISEGEHPVDIDRLLVVTFTNAAAAQMRERISKALSLRMEKEPDNHHLQRQLTLIHNAQITTIDSFCLYLIRNHFHDIDLDPDFRVADEGELKLLKQDVLAELLEEKFSEKDPAFLHCVECFAPGGKEKKLEEQIFTIYEFAMSYPWPEKWLEMHREDYRLESGETMEEAKWVQILKDYAMQMIKECALTLQQALSICEEPDGPYLYVPMLEADREQVERLLKHTGLKEMQENLQNLKYTALSRKKDDTISEEKRTLVKNMRDTCKGILNDLAEKYFSLPLQEAVEEMNEASPALESLVDLTLDFKRRLDESKRQKNILDFHDMEHMALSILLSEKDGKMVPSRTALEYREHFAEILIDEYQDSNLVQEFLLQSISGEDEGRFNRFMVGDVKQSIYKFRLARPELFMEKFDDYSLEEGNCRRIDLLQNFRSRKEVTDSVNYVFEKIMGKKLGGIEYDSRAALYPGAVFPEPEETFPNPYDTEVLLTPSSKDGRADKQKEARMIAARIKQMVGSFPVRDSQTGELRPARFGDMVILLRTTSGWDEEFRKILEEEGIPVFVTSRTGYFAAPEVQTVLNFLRVLNNPLQDIPLFGTMHSAAFGFTDEEIACIKAGEENKNRRLYVCLKRFAEGTEQADAKSGFKDSLSDVQEEQKEKLRAKAVQFLETVNAFRRYSVYLPIHKLMERFLKETGYLDTISVLPGGRQRRMNVEMLLAKAENFEKTSYFGLFHFVRYMEQMEKYDVDYGEASVLDENADTVRIMSIHKSKGLEFPICFVSGLAKSFNRQDTMKPVILDMDLGIAVDFIDPEKRLKRNTLKKAVLSRKLQLDNLGEELRVLYVAMTRAEEKLILTGTFKEEKNYAKPLSSDGKVPFGTLSAAGSYLELLMPVWLSGQEQEITYWKEEDFFGKELAEEAENLNFRQKLLFAESEPFADEEKAEELKERFRFVYPYENLRDLYVKTTVSELKKAGMYEEGEESFPLYPAREEDILAEEERKESDFPEEPPAYVPAFLRDEESKKEGVYRGNAYHKVMELFPFEKEGLPSMKKEELSQLFDAMQDRGRLPAEYREMIRPFKILTFLKSPLCERMHKAEKKGMLKREQPFVLGIPADLLNPDFPREETVLIQGIIDVFWEEEDGLVVADYKTDKINVPEELIKRYRIQLESYARALEQLTGKKVKEKIIYSFALEKEVKVP